MGGRFNFSLHHRFSVSPSWGRWPRPAFYHDTFRSLEYFGLYKLQQKHSRVIPRGSNRREHSKGGGWERKPIKKKYFLLGCKALKTSLLVWP